MRRTLVVSLFALVCPVGIYAQVVAGSGAIAGTIRDMYGDGIPDCTVTLTNKSIGVKRVVMTSDEGIFNASGLTPASLYDLKVTRRGYADWELPNFDISVGEAVNFKISLFADKAATPQEAVGAMSAVQDSKTSLSSLITDDQIDNLPTIDRRLDSLILLAPAVTETPQGVLVFRGEPFTNAFYVDGVEINNRYFKAHPGIAPFVTQDATGQMQVISAAPTAELGHALEGDVNSVSRIAAGQFHVNAYDYYGKNSWNSPDPFGNGFKPTGRRNRGGLSIGLPVADKFYIFGNAERINNSSQGLNRIANPLLVDSTGNNVLSSSCTATAAQCSAAVSLIKSQLNVKVPATETGTTGFVRLDFRPAEGESLSITAAVQSDRRPNGLSGQTVSANNDLLASNATFKDTNRYVSAAWTHVVSALAVNEFHGFWLRDTQDASEDPSLFPTSGPISITIAGTPFGNDPHYPYNLREQRFGGADVFSLTIGRHIIRVGADIGRNQDTMNQLYARYGQYNYSTLNAFALDYSANVKQLKNYTTFAQTLGTQVTDFSVTSLHGHGEDTWRPFARLTVTGGLRWEKDRLPHPVEPNAGVYQTSRIPSPNTNWQPRIGIAFMVDKRTVIRAGGGTYYQPFPGELLRDLYMGGALYQTNYRVVPSATSAPAYPKLLTSTSTLAANLATEFYTADRFRNPYTEAGNAGIERRLNRYVSLAASYVISKGVKLWTAYDRDLPGGVQVSETYTVNNAQGTAVNSYTTNVWTTVVGPSYQVETEGASRYKAAVAQVRTAPIFGLSAQLSYTWSQQAIDDVSGPRAYSLIPATYAPGDYNGDRGNSTFSQRNRAVLNWNWQPVFTKSNDVLSRFVLNGWQISGIGTYGSTMFTTPLVNVAGQQWGTSANMGYATTLNGTGGWGRVPFQSVNSLAIGSHSNLDVRLSKTIPFTERLHGQFIFEGYNVTNHQNNTAVNAIEFQSVLGVLRPVTGYGNPISDYQGPFGSGARHIQVGLKVQF